MLCFEKPFTFPSAGYELSAYIHIPSTGYSLMVLMLHGFTGNKIEASRLFVDIARALCRAGVAVFRFDYRCHGDSPLDFEEFRFEYALEDSENALKYILNNFNPRKMFLVGLSMGGHIAVRLAATHGEKLSGIILLAPAMKLGEVLRDFEKATMLQRVDNYVVFGPLRMKLEAFENMGKYNAIELAEKIKIPVLIIHAKDDPLVPYTQSTEFFEKLRIQDKKLLLLDEGGHVFSTYTSKTKVVSEIVSWIKEKLQQ